MAKVSRDQARALLRQDNPRATESDIELYVDQWITLVEAMDNLDRNGAVCAHNRTGAPIDNPYLKVRDRAQQAILRIRRVRCADSLWRAWRE